MDWTTLLDSMLSALGETVPSILGALAILVLGWLVAVLVRAGLRRGLRYAKLNERLQSATGSKLDLEGGFAKGAFYIVVVLALIGFLNALNLYLVSEPLQSLVQQVFAYAPKLAAGAILIVVAWVVAMVVRKLVTGALASTRLDEKISAEAGMRPASENLGDVLYWLVILLFLPAILGALGLQGLLLPVQGMVDQILATVPNIFAAAIITVVGWFVARLLRDLVSNLLSATGVDDLGRRAGLRGSMTFSKLLGLVTYVVVLIPAVIAALDALNMESISRPASEMLGTVMATLPGAFAAAVILSLTWFVAGFVSNLVSNLLEGVGFNEISTKIGLQVKLSEQVSPSKIVGKIIVFFAMVFAVVEAANQIGFSQLSALVATFIEFGSNILLGGVIILVGAWLSNLISSVIREIGGRNAMFLSNLARYAILGLVLAMGLRAMGIADDIVNLAFALTLGSVAVAVALAFGIGGRDAAGKQMEHWLRKLRGETQN